ncbi:MAG: hypothetical protein JXO22_06250, partial [Phycisphaerae bacterium]|nr:hypothetical protein [Phycisphaerae bacterium]
MKRLAHSHLMPVAAALLLTATLFAAGAGAQDKTEEPNYVKFSTEHFDVELDASAAEFRPYIEAYLELGYRMFQKYTEVDYNKMMEPVKVDEVHKPRFFYQFPVSDFMWSKGWGGGLTYWNNSQMNVALVRELAEEKMRVDQRGLSVMWHELANGWANVYVSHDGKPTNLPGWIAAEGHAGFLRSHAMIELGYPSGQIAEYKSAVEAFDKYMKGESHDPGGVCHVFVETLWQKYGWDGLRPVYRACQEEGLRCPEDDAAKANGMVAEVISRAVGENIVPFLENY